MLFNFAVYVLSTFNANMYVLYTRIFYEIYLYTSETIPFKGLCRQFRIR